ncbi:MAG: hypothetical protein KDE27_13045 [Planctomycetes bacterium]|nr:hypothetical protein [Planctomycetota bacterium]
MTCPLFARAAWLALTAPLLAQYDIENNDYAETAFHLGTVDNSAIVFAGVHETRYAFDFYSFTTVADGILEADAELYTQLGTPLGNATGGVQLPAGTYLLSVDEWQNLTFPRPYTITLRHHPAPIATLAAGGSVPYTFARLNPSSHFPSYVATLLRLVVPADGHCDVRVPTARIELLSAAMSPISDEIADRRLPTTSSNLYGGGLDTDLPAGTYYLRLVPAPAGIATFAFVPGSLPTLQCGVPVTGSLPLGNQNAVFYRLQLGAPERVGLLLQPMTGLPAANLMLFDAAVNRILWDDETGLGSPINRIDATLPAGQYWVASWAPAFQSGAGGFTLSYSCGAPSLTAVQPGRQVRALPLNQADTVTVELGTPTRLGVGIELLAASYDYLDETAVLDSSGMLRGQSRFPSNEHLGRELDPGTYYIVTRHELGFAVNYALQLRAPLERTAPGAHSTGEAGGAVLLGASLAALPSPIQLPGVLDGNLLIDPGLGALLGVAVLDPSGAVDWPLPFPAGQGIWLQSAHLATAVASGRFGNALR